MASKSISKKARGRPVGRPRKTKTQTAATGRKKAGTRLATASKKTAKKVAKKATRKAGRPAKTQVAKRVAKKVAKKASKVSSRVSKATAKATKAANLVKARAARKAATVGRKVSKAAKSAAQAVLPKRPVGRPRKVDAAASAKAATGIKRKPGRPRKVDVVIEAVKRRVGRPRKEAEDLVKDVAESLKPAKRRAKKKGPESVSASPRLCEGAVVSNGVTKARRKKAKAKPGDDVVWTDKGGHPIPGASKETVPSLSHKTHKILCVSDSEESDTQAHGDDSTESSNDDQENEIDELTSTEADGDATQDDQEDEGEVHSDFQEGKDAEPASADGDSVTVSDSDDAGHKPLRDDLPGDIRVIYQDLDKQLREAQLVGERANARMDLDD